MKKCPYCQQEIGNVNQEINGPFVLAICPRCETILGIVHR